MHGGTDFKNTIKLKLSLIMQRDKTSLPEAQRVQSAVFCFNNFFENVFRVEIKTNDDYNNNNNSNSNVVISIS